jgi:hypothetical protein
LRIIIYGDFRPPVTDIHFLDLGIVVEAGAVKESIVRSATCVLKALSYPTNFNVLVPKAKSPIGIVTFFGKENNLSTRR